MEKITKGILNGIKITGATTLFVVTLSICSKIISVTVKNTINVFKKVINLSYLKKKKKYSYIHLAS